MLNFLYIFKLYCYISECCVDKRKNKNYNYGNEVVGGMVMEKIINAENLDYFAYNNGEICKKPVRGIVIFFNGLNWREMHKNHPVEAEFCAEHGMLYVVPYNNPWAWMNKQAVGFTDEIMDVIFEKYSLDKDTPVLSSGKSMGGLSSLVYMVYAKRTPVACIADCPVCDAVYHFEERDDLPRTMYSALWNEDGNLEDALKSISPLHLADKMPDAKYHIFHCGDDAMVNLEKHSKVFVEKMKERNHSITFDIIPKRGHCDLDYNAKKLYRKYLLEAFE